MGNAATRGIRIVAVSRSIFSLDCRGCTEIYSCFSLSFTVSLKIEPCFYLIIEYYILVITFNPTKLPYSGMSFFKSIF